MTEKYCENCCNCDKESHIGNAYGFSECYITKQMIIPRSSIGDCTFFNVEKERIHIDKTTEKGLKEKHT